MTGLAAGAPFPRMEVPTVGGDRVTLGAARGENDWQMVVVYRGLHCPLCKRYIAELDGMVDAFNDEGVDVITLSADPQEKAQAFVDETGVGLTVGYGLSVAQMSELGLYLSDPRGPQETDHVFPEPGLFLINAAGAIQILDISNAPFARPDLQALLNGVRFVRANDYPVRGRHRAG